MTRTAPAAARAALAAVVASAVLALTPLAPAARAEGDHVKYYTVEAAHQGEPENLTEIAERFLGDGARAAELFALNAGRIQPDGTTLTDGSRLRAGWVLVLPWDAYGSEVRRGVPPPRSRRPARPRRPDGSPPPTATRPSARRRGAAPPRRRAPGHSGRVRASPPTRRGRTAGAGTSSWPSSTPASPAACPRSPAG